MPNINSLQTITQTSSGTFVIATDNGFARRIPVSSLTESINSQVGSDQLLYTTSSVTFDTISIVGTNTSPLGKVYHADGSLIIESNGHLSTGSSPGELILKNYDGSASIVIGGPQGATGSTGTVTITVGDTYNWIFDNIGNIVLPDVEQNYPNGPGRFESHNGYPSFLSYGSNSAGGPELIWMDTDNSLDDFSSNTTTRHSMWINQGGLHIGMNENGAGGVARNRTVVKPNGNIEITNPNTPKIISSNGLSILAGTTSTTSTSWTFGLNGGLQFPDSTVQTTAYLGYTGARSVAVPLHSNSTGTVGDIASDSGYVYLCVATDTWRKVQHLGTW